MLTGISYRAIEFVAEHPINHNLLLQCHSSHLKLSKPKRDFKIQILQMNFTLLLYCFSFLLSTLNLHQPAFAGAAWSFVYSEAAACQRLKGNLGGSVLFRLQTRVEISAHLASEISHSFLGVAFIKISFIEECCNT